MPGGTARVTSFRTRTATAHRNRLVSRHAGTQPHRVVKLPSFILGAVGATLALAFGGCSGGDSHEKVADDIAMQMDRIAISLSSVADKASAEKSRDRHEIDRRGDEEDRGACEGSRSAQCGAEGEARCEVEGEGKPNCSE